MQKMKGVYCLGYRISQHFIDQYCLHVNSFQFEQLFTLDGMEGIVILTSRSILTDEQNHVYLKAHQLLDCVGLEIENGSICLFIPLTVFIVFKLCGIPFESKYGIAKVCLVDDPFLEVLSYL